jgi:hypothetical protein
VSNFVTEEVCMSRYYLRCPESDRYFAVVGWDAPLETFFTQVIDRAKLDESERGKPAAEAEYDHESVVLWRGTKPGELPTMEHLAKTLAAYTMLPEELARKLAEEQATSEKPSPLQRRMMELFAPGR